MTGQQLGDAIGCSKQNISHWEAGRFEPNLSYITKICETLDVSSDWLLLGKTPEPLSVGALKQARFYDSLSPEAKRRWETLKMLMVEGVPDATVEQKMPATASPPSGVGSYKKITPIPVTTTPGKKKKET